METFKTISKTEDRIVLKEADRLEILFQCIQNEEDFILQWDGKNGVYSKVIIATNILSKVKNGEITLIATENKEE